MDIPTRLNISSPVAVVQNPENKDKTFSRLEAIEIGKLLNIKFDKFSIEEFIMGLNVELEHGTKFIESNITFDDPILTGKIALVHLNEMSNYYTKLKKMEGE